MGDGPSPFYYPPNDTTMVRGEGVYVWDADGRRYIDCASGTFNLLLGYSHPEVIEAVQEQAGRLAFASSTFQTDPVRMLASELVRLSPPNLTRVHLKNTGGSTANEGAIKIAQHVTGKRDVITLFRSHLGQTMMMTSISGDASRRAPFPYRYPGSVQVPDPYCYRCFYRQTPATCGLLCVERIADFIEYASSGSVACVIVEPVSGAGGNVVAPPGYLAELKRLCEREQMILIFDEVQTAFGRTGAMFAADHFGVAPHIMTLAKGMTGSGFPLGALLTEERLTGLDTGYHGFTYGAYALAAAAAAKTLEVVQRPGFLDHVREVGRLIEQRMRALQAERPEIGDVRGLGLMLGVELVTAESAPDDELTRAIARAAFERGVVMRTSRYGNGNVLKLRPPLTITKGQADDLCDRLTAAFADHAHSAERIGATGA
jgi:validone 7-phosphate aminotransferase